MRAGAGIDPRVTGGAAKRRNEAGVVENGALVLRGGEDGFGLNERTAGEEGEFVAPGKGVGGETPDGDAGAGGGRGEFRGGGREADGEALRGAGVDFVEEDHPAVAGEVAMADGEDGERREVFRDGGRGGGGCGLPREAREERFVFREIEGERGAWAGGGCGGRPVEREEIGGGVVRDANFAVGREAAEIDGDGGAGEGSE